MGGQDVTISMDLPAVAVTGQRQGAAKIEVGAQREAATAVCPACRREVANVHDRRPRRNQDVALAERPVTIGANFVGTRCCGGS